MLREPFTMIHFARRSLVVFVLASIVLIAAYLTTRPWFDASDSGYHDWRHYLGDLHSSQYSSLSQINTGNVNRLERAWIYNTGAYGQMQCNPIVVDRVLYGVTAHRQIFALNAATGEELWRFSPPHATGPGPIVRGLMWWESDDVRRLLFGAGNHLYSIDADTGSAITSFGENGAVNLKKGFDRDATKLHVISTSPGVIYKDLVIVSTRLSERNPAAPGDIRAYDVRTGERRWIFHTIPHPGELGYETWPPDAWNTAGGANCWAGMSLDQKRGIVYIPTGAAAYDFYGGDRHGENLYANCILALKAETGERVWHFQTVHHDLWDRDIPAPPNLVSVMINGQRREAVAQITKSSFVFLLDRDTGEPLHPVKEVPVAASDVKGEAAWPTQPVPVRPPPFARQAFTEDMVAKVSPESHDEILERLKRSRTGRQFLPPSLEGTVVFPGFDGGGEWGGASVDPHTGIMYVNSSEMPWILTLYELSMEKERGGEHLLGRRVYATNCIYCHGVELEGDPLRIFPPLKDLNTKYTPEQMGEIVLKGKERMPAFEYLSEKEVQAVTEYLYHLEANRDLPAQIQHDPETSDIDQAEDSLSMFTHTGYNRFVGIEGYPAVEPPWGTLNAIDLNKGEILWKVPLGNVPELGDRGFRNTGTENYGGPVATAGGLIFIAATKDEKLRAFSMKDGKELWSAPLPAAGYATPCTYEIDGRQYVVIAAGGAKIGTKPGDAYVAFSLGEDYR